VSAIGGTAADESGTVPAILHDDRVPLAAWVIAAAYVVLMLAVSDRYGFQQDELYFLVASHHLAFGYADQPPLAVLLARTTDLFGVNPAAIRILPALAGGAIVVLAVRLAALFGGGRAARVIAALAVAIAPVFLAAMHIGNTTPYDLLAWTVVTVCAAMALLRDRPRWWLGAGVAAGIGVEDEYLILTLLAALVIGILVTPAHRAVMKTRWPWLGGVIALVIWLPNLVWQFASGWPQLTMASALHQQNTSTADYAGGLPLQLAAVGLLGIPLVIAYRDLRPGLDTGEGVLRRRDTARCTGRRVRTGRAVDRESALAARPACGRRCPRAGRHHGHLAEHAAPAADREPAQGERGNDHRRRHRLAAADCRSRGAGRGAHPGGPAADVHLYRCLRGGRRA
jgi:hypothetical protein